MSDSKLGFNAAWSMAVGGMIGGGIFSTLGVVISVAGSWAWLSFMIGGVVALLAAYAYVNLARHYGEGGGAFTFLREIHAEGFAGTLSWILLIGYVLTNAVYAFTFGEYVAHVMELGPWLPRVAAVTVLALFVLLNLRGVGEAGGVEVFLVWFKVFALVGLAGFGLARWDLPALSRGLPDSGLLGAVFGAASVFMAYEGFQLLTYDYEDIDDPDRTLPAATFSAVAFVALVYVIVTLGTSMLVGADRIVENEEVALAVAGREALGSAGLILVTIAAAFSTGSAINSTLFATARLSHTIAAAGELPAALDHHNAAGAPDRAVIGLGALAALLAVVGSLTTLVEAASLAFLFTFGVVSGLAFLQRTGNRWLTAAGTLGAAGAVGALSVRLAGSNPAALASLVGLTIVVAVSRPMILSRVRVEVS